MLGPLGITAQEDEVIDDDESAGEDDGDAEVDEEDEDGKVDEEPEEEPDASTQSTEANTVRKEPCKDETISQITHLKLDYFVRLGNKM